MSSDFCRALEIALDQLGSIISEANCPSFSQVTEMLFSYRDLTSSQKRMHSRSPLKPLIPKMFSPAIKGTELTASILKTQKYLINS